MISFVSSADVLTLSHRFLNVADDGIISTEYLAAAVRRLAGAICPCSPKTLLKVMVDSHRGLFSETDVFADQVESVIDDLVSVGDLLELSDVSTVDERIKGTWLFAAPPGFVIHHGEVAYIIGISSDEQTPLPAAIRDRVIVEGVTRRIAPNPPEDLGPLLSALGLREIPSTVWLSRPRPCSARDLIVRADGRLSSSTRLGEEDGVRVFDHRMDSRSYRRCWEPLANQDGKFIIKRPQAYGADRWGYAKIADGGVANVFEFPEPGDRARGCDIAWRMMAALKALQGDPIRYRSMDGGDMSSLDFFFPVPDWARRTLRFSGREVVSRNCLLSFDVPVGSANAIHRFLNDMLFFEQQSD